MFVIFVDSSHLTFCLDSLRLSLRNANLQAKANMRKAAEEEAMFLTTFSIILISVLPKCFLIQCQ